MVFEDDIFNARREIRNAKTSSDLDSILMKHRKKYWWASFFMFGLFYGLNNAGGRMLITCVLLFSIMGISVYTGYSSIGGIPIGFFGLFAIYTSYKDQKAFNHLLNRLIQIKEKKLKRGEEDEENERADELAIEEYKKRTNHASELLMVILVLVALISVLTIVNSIV